jgi:pilus assembly protein CpaF
MEGNTITTQTIFGFEQVDVGESGKVIGDFYASGVMPKFMKRVEQYGCKIPPIYFLASDRNATRKCA